ncbi:hypothetical protein COY51_00635 [Candidatus Desantisbacteria bacterium CG_4_10_14_0_8_um_filter_39_17]|uniref:Amidohydrolase-related domain-containing protein n=1 Tax=Candidatus Desantisbacteria bacterium CG_4_10_14_0_8_um_filter_39_17 TaxID=1974542 RepID=A0A2H9PCZ5_9BACT|nr:MAG: hypothetical protein COY51_00635 [Candidatus Desantisbacteria bacterium CG_4_10_14_0_8_um_filter_39_17]
MIIDVNVNFGFWPFQKFHENTLRKLNEHLKKENISFALISSLEAVFYPDPEMGNQDLLMKLKKYKNLLPVAVANPKINNWKEILGNNKYKAIKIIPNYHYYSLLDKKALDLIGEVNNKKITLIIQMRFEDERSHYPLLKVKGVSVQEIKEISLKFPALSIIALCPYFAESIELANLPNVCTDISFVESLDTLHSLLAKVPAEKVLFGSHTPFLYTKAAIMKLKYGSISKKDYEKIAYKNASQLFNIEKFFRHQKKFRR